MRKTSIFGLDSVLCAALGMTFLSLAARPASAVTTLGVDLAKPLGPVTHLASGSLYGITELLPADVTKLVLPLKPNMFNNPAANVQQPRGDAIVVAGRVAPLGARVTIRLADWFPSWPYAFTNMTDWFDKLGQTVARKQASGLDNYYGYEIWNEPDGTWKTSLLDFHDFWKQSYDKLRELDPSAKIIGPSIAGYDRSYLEDFLAFGEANDCLPDIVGWHELRGDNLTSNFQDYRALEKRLGIGPLPISINEYSGKERIDDEGQPGASAPIIAKFERFGVDSACISYWDVAHAGRLGSLLASDTAPNGGWWFYKWYGDMSGTMLTTTPPSPNDASALDGFANFDASARSASVLFAGVNDGTVRIVVRGFAAAQVLGSRVRAVVEHTPFVNRTTPVNAIDTVSTAELDVTSDEVSVDVTKANASDGYRLTLTSLDGGGAAGFGGAGGTSGGSGTTGASLGGASTAGAASTAGGVGNAAGKVANGGAGAVAGGAVAGESSLGASGATAVSAAGGVPNIAGASGTAARGFGGLESGGQAGSLALGASGGVPGASGAANVRSAAGSRSAEGCGCGVAGRVPHPSFALVGLGIVFLRRRGRLPPRAHGRAESAIAP